MSGGEQQMLAISRALMLSPRLLLIDEISMGLMPILVNHSLSIIKRLNSEGLTVLMVEQNANKALKVAERGYILKTGKITMHDTSENLRNNDDVVKAYLGE
jgi:branched-chain amino acid transport system ATP-binding protein